MYRPQSITTWFLCAVTLSSAATADAAFCTVPDSGGTAALPPAGCDYITPQGDMQITNGVPLGTTIDFDATLGTFFNVNTFPGGILGGEVEQFDAVLTLPTVGTGALAGFNRLLFLQPAVETHSGPRVPNDPVQAFPTEMVSLSAQLFGDPDFDFLFITAGMNFGLPSPGNTTLTRLGGIGSDWNVDSFFDVTYEIDFQGAPGSVLEGMGGVSTGVVRLQLGMPVIPEPSSAGLVLLGLAAPVMRLR